MIVKLRDEVTLVWFHEQHLLFLQDVCNCPFMSSEFSQYALNLVLSWGLHFSKCIFKKFFFLDRLNEQSQIELHNVLTAKIKITQNNVCGSVCAKPL